MENTFILRLLSNAGFSRIEVPINSNLSQFKKEIQSKTNVLVKDQKLFFDKDNKNPINLADSTPIVKLGLKQGDLIYLSNSNAETISVEVSKPVQKKCAHSEREVCINCMDTKIKKEEPKKSNPSWVKGTGLTPKCTHNVGQKCLHCMETPSYKGELKYNCTHGENGKCPNCVGKEFIVDAKHKSFDQFLNERKEKCKGIHEESGRCNNCMPPQETIYKMKTGCTNHRPYPEGLCNKCSPPNVILGRQVYRHVDYVSFMNQEELNNFVNNWTKGLCMKQKMAFLYGYYAADPNYPDGVRAVVELLYEPPQLSDTNSCEPLVDKDEYLVNSIAESLSLECIGWIFTSISTEKDVCLTSYDVRKAARYQQKYVTVHPSGYKVSKFFTVVVKPKENMECVLETYMISDLGQALERDNILDDSTQKKLMQIRKPKSKTELISTVYMESKQVESFDPDFLIVNLSHGLPVNKKDMNILKSYDFPVAIRLDKKTITESEVKDYFKRHKKDKPLVKYSNFFCLLYLAKVIDLSTAVNFGNQIANSEIDADIVEELLTTILGNF